MRRTPSPIRYSAPRADRREGAEALRGEHDPEATAAVRDERPEARQLGLDPRLLEPAGQRHRRHAPVATEVGVARGDRAQDRERREVGESPAVPGQRRPGGREDHCVLGHGDHAPHRARTGRRGTARITCDDRPRGTRAT